MLSIKDNISNELSIKKSRFITYLYRVDTIDDIKSYLDKLNSKYKDATHICYAYVIDNIKRFSDDGEPQGTAGMPILNVLEGNNLNHVLCCVVRYFGGIKLGANGLVRAYSNCVKSTIECSSIINLVLGKICNIEFRYDDTKLIDNMLKNSVVVYKNYDKFVSYTFKIYNDELDNKINDFHKLGNFTILDDCFIERN